MGSTSETRRVAEFQPDTVQGWEDASRSNRDNQRWAVRKDSTWDMPGNFAALPGRIPDNIGDRSPGDADGHDV